MRKYVFKWVLSTGYNSATHSFEEKLKRPITDCGSDAVLWIDGRLNKASIMRMAEEWIKKTGGIGYSVGYLKPHDPEERASQSLIKFTEVNRNK